MTLRWSDQEFEEWRLRKGRHATPKAVLSSLTIPLQLPSLANQSVHPLKRWRQGRAQKKAVLAALTPYLRPKLPAVITLTRFGPRKLDTDNLAMSFKAARDQIAAWIGVDDGSDLYVWRYEQEKAKDYAIRIDVM